MSTLSPRQRELLHRAADCFQRAGLAADACRLFERLDEPLPAARLHEALGELPAAAACYRRANHWGDAARCLLACGEVVAAAEAFQQAGQHLEAAWLLADRAGHPGAARVLVQAAAAATPEEEIAIALIEARCDAESPGAPVAARLRQTIVRIGATPLPTGRIAHLLGWARAVAQRLRRPDLAILTHAAAFRAGGADALPTWERWAREVLHDASGLPRVTADGTPEPREQAPRQPRRAELPPRPDPLR